jgi:hypothetical protein
LLAAAVIFVEQPEGLCGLTNPFDFDVRDFRVHCRPGRNNFDEAALLSSV